MKKTFLLSGLVLLSYFSDAQNSVCTTSALSASELDQLRQSAPFVGALNKNKNSSVLRSVSLNINILVYDNGPITTVAQVQAQVDSANVYFANAGIEFNICNVSYIVNSSPLPFWDASYENQLGLIYDLKGFLNIYFVNYVVNASAYAYYPQPYSPDRIVMGQHLSGEVFAHELGHSFYLIHTHGNYNSGNGTDELVNGSNCLVAGDVICDTPADPNLIVAGRVDSLCNYADTVTVDSLGMLYAPDTKNIMSYTPFSCYDHFTPGQDNRIAYTLAHQRAFLKSGMQLSSVINAPSSICMYDSPAPLSAIPAGGTFSGPGVTGNTFDPVLAGPGTHIISYSNPNTPVIVETTDQYCQYADTSAALNQVWQSFTADMDENLLGFSFYLTSVSTQNIYVSVYDSTGISGTLLVMDTVSVNADSLINWNKFTFQTPLHLDAGHSYTIAAAAVSSNITFAGMKGNAYQAGQGSHFSDLSFITHVLPDVPVCGNSTTAVIRVSDPPKPVISELFSVYCINAPARYIIGIPGGGTATIDGITDSILDPAALGPGTHVLHYEYTDYWGCSNDSNFTFTVNDTTAIVNLPPVVCSNDSVISLTGVPPGGVFYLDGLSLPLPELDPASLTTGSHTISYTCDAEYPWIDTLDQTNQIAVANAMFAMGPGQNAWQSFTAGMKGYMNRFVISLYTSDTVSVPFHLYKGEGTSGQLLYTDTAIRGGNSTMEVVFNFNPFQLLLEKDSIYTFEFSIYPYTNNFLTYSDSNKYAGGKTHFAMPGLDTDFEFATYVNSLYQCGADSVASTFNLVNNPVVNLGYDTTLTIGEILNLDAGNTGNTFIWSTGETTQQISVSGPVGTGIIWVQVTSADGCTANDSITINFVAGISQVASAYFQLSPNPVTDEITIHSKKAIDNIRIENMPGELLFQKEFGHRHVADVSIPAAFLPPGIYLARIRSGNEIHVLKFIKN